jgi:hypothetical protein
VNQGRRIVEGLLVICGSVLVFFCQTKGRLGNPKRSDVIFARQQVDNPLYTGSAMFIFPLDCAKCFPGPIDRLSLGVCSGSRLVFLVSVNLL